MYYSDETKNPAPPERIEVRIACECVVCGNLRKNSDEKLMYTARNYI